MATTRKTFDRFDYGCMATLVVSATFISLASPALYVLLWIVLGFIGVAAASFVITKELLASDCPLDNIVGVNALFGCVRLVGLLLMALCGVSSND